MSETPQEQSGNEQNFMLAIKAGASQSKIVRDAIAKLGDKQREEAQRIVDHLRGLLQSKGAPAWLAIAQVYWELQASAGMTHFARKDVEVKDGNEDPNSRN